MEDIEHDDVAAAMGFSSFGGTKKRKYDQTSSPKSRVDASGANTTRLGVRSKIEQEESSKNAAEPEPSVDAAEPHAMLAKDKTKQHQHAAAFTQNQSDASPMVSFGGPAITQTELAALRNGVLDENGDRAYFLPSFVKDPWETPSKERN
ncbi:hypothetical protein BU23DRAFT_446373 [Bimuria novae-zelandiae CBS 107.79]|uniref:Uncharacterized protein n=1 Tax=Bimuria novae-zelandiae CBS 107.79 TaxID=1447943 RepID=A0A6A5VRN9_9PLEO|nr:hypothetical protein BU23DRAFT_446373 [Bimuria novae-zelandiae CBS 107.79]